MKIVSGKMIGPKFKLHRIKNSKGRYITGSIVLVEHTGKEITLKRNECVGTQDMIMMINLSGIKLLWLSILSLFGVKDHYIGNK